MTKKKFAATSGQRLAAHPDYSVWVTANAGSGKTHVLVERIIRLLLSGAEPSTILCITFTKAAAAEMSARLFSRMSSWILLDDKTLADELRELSSVSPSADDLLKARRLFARALETPGGLKIQTIHAFCEKLLQQFPIEAGIAPGFRVLDERQNNLLLDTAISTILHNAESNPYTEVGAAFSNIVDYLSSTGFESLIRQFLSDAKRIRQILRSELTATNMELLLKNSLSLDIQARSDDLAEELVSIDRQSYQHHAQVLTSYKIHNRHDAAYFMKAIGEPASGLNDLRAMFLTKANTRRDSFIAKTTQKERPSTAAFLEEEAQRVVSLLEAHDLLLRVEATAKLFVLAKAIYLEVENQKRSKAQYDFDDLINRTNQLLSSSKAAQWVLYKLDTGLKHILIDEAQDTSPAQWNIISALAQEFFAGHGQMSENIRTLFVVGDRKQSIYSFQGADVRALAEARRALSTHIVASGKKLAKVDLSISYRSTEQILNAVDIVFPPSHPARLGFDAEDDAENPHQSSRLGEAGVFALWPLFEPEGDDEEKSPWLAPVDREPGQSPRRRLARHLATTIKSWIGKRKIAALNRFVEPGDILILLQSRGPFFSMLIAELRKAGVPVSGADRLKLLESLAVQDILSLLQWLLLPQDDYALSCVLKSPLVPKPLDEDELMTLAIDRGSTSMWERLQLYQNANAIWLSKLKLQVLELGIYELCATILTQSRKAMTRRLGTEAIDASNAFLDQALTYEAEYGRSLSGFLHWFQSGETSIKREMEQLSGEVRLMTVHGAKGLEANIVILADAASVPSGGQSEPQLLSVPDNMPSAGVPLWVLNHLTVAPVLQNWKEHAKAKKQAERNRLLYVAMTRARDELYVTGAKSSKKIPEDSWYATIANAMEDAGFQNNVAPLLIESADAIAASSTDNFELPPWAKQIAKAETGQSLFSLTGLIKRKRNADLAQHRGSAERGIAIHALLQELPSIAFEQREIFARNWARRSHLDVDEVLRLVAIVGSNEFGEFYGPESQAEAELRGKLPDGREVSGRVDRIVIGARTIKILDYKSDRDVPTFLPSAHPYVQQMRLYTLLLQAAYPQHVVSAAILWTQTATLAWIAPEDLTQSRDDTFSELEREAP